MRVADGSGTGGAERDVDVQIYQLADELRVRSVDVLDAAQMAGVKVNGAGSELDDAQVDQIRAAHRDRLAAAAAAAASPQFLPPPPLVSAGVADVALHPAPAAPPVVAGPMPPGGGVEGGPCVADKAPRPARPAAGKAPMHPLIKTALWQFAAAHVVPCIGIYWFFAAYINAGKGRRQVAWFHGKWGGDTAGLVIQILFWVELAITVAAIAFTISQAGSTPSPATLPN